MSAGTKLQHLEGLAELVTYLIQYFLVHLLLHKTQVEPANLEARSQYSFKFLLRDHVFIAAPQIQFLYVSESERVLVYFAEKANKSISFYYGEKIHCEVNRWRSVSRLIVFCLRVLLVESELCATLFLELDETSIEKALVVINNLRQLLEHLANF